MAWICNPCHVIETGRKASDVHFQGSYGPCESCHLTRDCGHCQCTATYPLTDVNGNPIPENVERAAKEAAAAAEKARLDATSQVIDVK